MLVLIPLVTLSFPWALAAERVTVEQLKQKLSAPASAGSDHSAVPVAVLQDATMAVQIANLQLSERLTSTTLDHILREHTLGPRTQREMVLLADRSALLDPPAKELSDRPAPDADQQQHMLDAARAYVFQTLDAPAQFLRDPHDRAILRNLSGTERDWLAGAYRPFSARFVQPRNHVSQW